jgi:energy-coupling factor transporter ATP-binding protein EcfA2
MPSSLFLSALDTRIEVAFGPEVSQVDADRFAALWDGALAENDEGSPDARIRVMLGTSAIDPGPFDVVAARFEEAAAQLSTRVTLAAIESQKSRLVMLHACGVATEEGEVFAFVGPSGRGKTTLVSNLGQKLAYVTDETVGISDDGAVRPYRKPLSRVSLRGAKEQLAPSQLGLRSLPAMPLRIASIALIDRRSEHSGAPRIDSVGLAEALPLLVPELSYLPTLERPLQRLAELITATGGVKRLSYGEAGSIDRNALDELITKVRVDAWSPVPLLEPALPGEGEFAHEPPLDGLLVGSVLVLLHGSTVRVLDGIGPAIWAATHAAASINAIIGSVEERHGSPTEGSAAALVASAVQELVDAGILRQG